MRDGKNGVSGGMAGSSFCFPLTICPILGMCENEEAQGSNGWVVWMMRSSDV
jgi:hypothetical protein